MNTQVQNPTPGSEAERQMQDARRTQDFQESLARRQHQEVAPLDAAPVETSRARALDAAPTPTKSAVATVKKAAAKKAPAKKSAPVKKAVAPAKVAAKKAPVKKAAAKKK